MQRQSLLLSAAVAAIAAFPVSASAQGAPELRDDIRPFFGDIDPFRGDIDPFAGDIDPFAGDINPFRGDIDPFYGDISPFWGDIDPFWGDIDPFAGDIDVFWGDINPASAVSGQGAYWAQVGPMWGDINASWNALGSYSALTAISYSVLANDFQTLVDTTRTTWNAAIQSKTGQSFDVAFANPILAKYGIDLNDPTSLASIDAATRSQFFLEWYDSLEAYSGKDRVDHWMPLINWTPVLTQDQGEGHDAVVGLLDVAISSTDDNIEFLVNEGGYQVSANEHGAAVASLIAGRHDGEGVMGIAPRATVHSYAPFDDSGSASFADVAAGVAKLTSVGANVINMSLGVPTWTLNQEIADIFSSSATQAYNNDTVFVVASGNEGVTQTADVNWTAGAEFDNLLFVGSVGSNKVISPFSNRPGEACLTVNGQCAEENKLKYRFLVAPGELILVSDNNGGTTRLSGTSFAAPLVTGAVSLIHDRWPWLQQHADETADIILQSAEDLGAPGVDGVYGYGLLDVEAAQSPLDFNNLTFHQPNGSGGFNIVSANNFRNSLIAPGQLDLWQLSGEAVFAMETIGDTYRDFSIPLSTLLYGQSGTFNGGTERYQRHVYNRLVDWAGGNTLSLADTQTASIGLANGFNVTMFASPRAAFASTIDGDRPFDTALSFKSVDGSKEFLIGQGLGALSLNSTQGFDQYSDYDVTTSGHNPFLGLASGGAFAKFTTEVLPKLKVAFGFSEKNDDHTYADPTTNERLRDPVAFDDFQVNAILAEVQYAVADRVTLNATFTHVEEENSVLGAQGSGAFAFSGGSRSDAVTIGASVDLGGGFRLSGSTTAGRTHSEMGPNAILGLSQNGLTSTASQVALSKKGVFTKQDKVRFSFAQPLHVESGSLRYQSVQVVDRATGELGVVDQQWSLAGGGRHYVAEAQYAVPLMEGRSELSLFGRMDIGDVDIDGQYDAFAGGARFTMSF